MRNPYTWNADAGLRRSVPLHREGTEFTFEADCVNVWNHVTFSGPNASWASGSSSFETITGVSSNPGPRDWQFAAISLSKFHPIETAFVVRNTADAVSAILLEIRTVGNQVGIGSNHQIQLSLRASF